MKNLVSIICVALLLLSCQEEMIEESKQYPQEKVNMKFALQAAGLSQPEYRSSPTRAIASNGLELTFGTTPQTRAVEALPTESVIKDLIVMQFDGTEDHAAAIGTPQYFPQYDAEPSVMSFIASNGDNHTIYFVANSGRDLGPDIVGKTLGDFKKMVCNIPTEVKLVEGQGLLMTGLWTGGISNDADIKEVVLSRAMAKVSFHLTNKLSSGYIQSVSVENVPASVNYTGLFDNTTALQITYPTKTYDGETEYTWYVPENLNTEKEKSTCIVVTVGLSGSAMVHPCRIYLNLSEEAPDYSLKRNYRYDISVTLRGTASTEGELLIDCHYVKADVATKAGEVVTSDANWIDVSTSGVWESGLSQTVIATGSRTYLHINDNLTEEDRTATVTVSDGVNTTKIPVKQKAIQKVGLFGDPDADGVYTKMLGMEMIEENTRQPWHTSPQGPGAGFDETDKLEIFSGKSVTAKYGTSYDYPLFSECYQKNKDKNDIQWYLPAQAQLWAMYVAQGVANLKTSGSGSSGGYYTATYGTKNAPIYALMSTCSWASISGPERRRNVRCVRDIP